MCLTTLHSERVCVIRALLQTILNLLNISVKEDKELKVLNFLGEKYVNDNRGIKPAI